MEREGLGVDGEILEHQADSKAKKGKLSLARRRLSQALASVGVVCLAITISEACGLIDLSGLTGPFFGNLPVGLPPANEFAFEGGTTGTDADAFVNNVLPPALFRNDAGLPIVFDLPTNGPPSPLFGAQPFTQQMLRFEEFGTEPLPASFVPGSPFPPPLNAQSGPDVAALDSFLAQPIFPAPTRLANCVDQNPWQPDIEAFLGRPLNDPPAEGRPPGEGWAHQRWDEFPPQVYYTTAQAGARTNTGLRDVRQLHGYGVGEFGPVVLGFEGETGLYHNTAGAPGFEGTTAGIPIAFHPNMPIQDPSALWTFDGTFPPKLLMARYGQSILMRHYNALPIDPSSNLGFGLHAITTHEHNGHTPAESDGYTQAFFLPGEFYDYLWPLQLAGYDTVNRTALQKRAATPCSPGETMFVQGVLKPCMGGTIQIPGDWRETMSTHWFHDHMLDFTAQNVYKGNAVMMNYYSAVDRGNEGVNDGVSLPFPSGTALPWGNRDYDVNLMIADKAWDSTGQLWFNIFNLNGFMGDKLLTNWLYNPYMDVRARRYRFRFLNGSVSRYIKVALVKEVVGAGGEMPGPPGSGVSYNHVPFHMIANDGNIMEHSVLFDGTLGTDNAALPTQGIAERYDIVVDFGQFQPGDKLYFVNLLEHLTGKKPSQPIPLADVLSEFYLPTTQDDNLDGIPDRWINGDPCVGKFMELRVQPYSGTDLSLDPANYVAGGLIMIPLHRPSSSEIAEAKHRTFEFGTANATDTAPWTIRTDGGVAGFGMDPRRLSAAPNLGDLTAEGGGHLEIWHIVNTGGGWSHPVHVHFEEGIILRRGGVPPPEWEKWARKDLYRIGSQKDSTSSVEMAIRFREFAGTFMEHCHNTQHEDHAMLLRWDIERPGQFAIMPTPMPTWDGVGYVDTVALPTARTGDGIGPSWSPGGEDCTLTGCPDSCSHCNISTKKCAWCTFDDNYNGTTDGFDFSFLSGCFGACYAANDPCLEANYDQSPDNCVGGSDFAGFSGCFGKTCTQCALCDPSAPPLPIGSGLTPKGSLSVEMANADYVSANGTVYTVPASAAIQLVTLDEPSESDFAFDLPVSNRSYEINDTFYVEVWAARTDVTDGSEAGLGAVYADIVFDPLHLAAAESVPSALFNLFSVSSSTAREGRLPVGGCAPLGDGTVGVDTAWVRVATLRMNVIGEGVTRLTVGPSQAPFGVSIFGRFGNLAKTNIDFGGAGLSLSSVSPDTRKLKLRRRAEAR